MRAVCSGTRGRGCCGWSDIAKPPAITAPTPLSTFRPTHSPTVSGLYGDIDVKVRVQRQRSSSFVGREDGYELIRGEFAIGRAGHRAATLYPVGLLGPEP